MGYTAANMYIACIPSGAQPDESSGMDYKALYYSIAFHSSSREYDKSWTHLAQPSSVF
jgi:hypothetical protein